MSNNNSDGGGKAAWFMIGALLVAVVGFGVYYFSEQQPGQDQASLEITVDDEGVDVDAE